MILTVDIGNTNIVLGGFDGDQLHFVSRLSTNHATTEDEYAVTIWDILSLHSVGRTHFEGAIVSSVVPKLLPVLKKAIKKRLGCQVLSIGPGIKTGVNIKTDDPSVLGADFVCAAAGVMAHYPLPAIVVDLGTATKIFALQEKGVFLGTAIMPGVNISLDALASRTAQLPHISIEGTPPVIGTNTVDSMQSGIIYGTAASIDGMVELYQQELGINSTVIATGGLASSIIPHCRKAIILDSDLILKGLLSIYRKNS